MEIALPPIHSGSDPAALVRQLGTSYTDPSDQRLLVGGLRAAVDHGLTALTVEQAAAAADASPATIYRRFGKSRQFRYHILNYCWTELVRRLAYADFVGSEGDETGFEKIRSFGATLASFIDDDGLRPMVSLAVAADRRPTDTETNLIDLPGKQALARRLHSICVLAIKDGSAPPQFERPRDLATAVWLEFVPAWVSATIIRRNRGTDIANEFARTVDQALDELFDDGGTPPLESPAPGRDDPTNLTIQPSSRGV